MTDALESWARPHRAEGGGDAFLFYVAFGDVAHDAPLSRDQYRSAGVPAGLELAAYDRDRHGEVVESFLQGYAWEDLRARDRGLAQAVEAAPGCVVLRGGVRDPETLDYLRDAVGLLAFLLDHGARAVYDPQMLRWWSPAEWRRHLFAPAAPVPRLHVSILISPEAGARDRAWIHTRGMRKFGRPDLSVRHVGSRHHDAVVRLCGRFIEYQAFGGVIPEGREIRMDALPPGGIARHGGELDDPDFNNVHVAIAWPASALA